MSKYSWKKKEIYSFIIHIIIIPKMTEHAISYSHAVQRKIHDFNPPDGKAQSF